MSPHEPSHAAAGIPLEAPVEELRSRCEAVARLQGGSTYFHEELGIFRQHAEESGLFLQASPVELIRTPAEEGNEHQVWFDEASQSYLKAFLPRQRRCILEPRVARPRYPGSSLCDASQPQRGCDPCNAYLTATDETVLPFIFPPADSRDRAHSSRPTPGHRTQSRWDCISRPGWATTGILSVPLRPLRHRGNLILMDDGLLAPIDLRVQRLADSLLDTVTRLAS